MISGRWRAHRMSALHLFMAGMALTLLAVLVVVGAGSVQADAATDLIISEYIEGSSYNKALEIYNGTGAAIDLNAGDYDIQFFFNGSTSPGRTIARRSLCNHAQAV